MNNIENIIRHEESYRVSEDEINEDEIKDDERKENEMKEDEKKENEIKEDEIKEDEIKEDEIKEDKIKEDKTNLIDNIINDYNKDKANKQKNQEESENDLHDNLEDLGGIKLGEQINYNKLYEVLEKYCNLKRQTHWMCARYYNKLDRIFLIPSILLSSFSGVASFLSSVESFSDYQTELSIGVGIMASCTTLLQSFSNAFGFSSKDEAHQNATEAFDQIITKIRFQRINPKEDLKDTEFIQELENQIIETKQRCKYVVPDWIEEEYRDNKFNNLKHTLFRNVYKQLINIKTDKYLSAVKKKEFSKIDLNNIDIELGLKRNEEIECC